MLKKVRVWSADIFNHTKNRYIHSAWTWAKRESVYKTCSYAMVSRIALMEAMKMQMHADVVSSWNFLSCISTTLHIDLLYKEFSFSHKTNSFPLIFSNIFKLCQRWIQDSPLWGADHRPPLACPYNFVKSSGKFWTAARALARGASKCANARHQKKNQMYRTRSED